MDDGNPPWSPVPLIDHPELHLHPEPLQQAREIADQQLHEPAAKPVSVRVADNILDCIDSATMTIPQDPNLVGLSFCIQCVESIFDICLNVSQATQITIEA